VVLVVEVGGNRTAISGGMGTDDPIMIVSILSGHHKSIEPSVKQPGRHYTGLEGKTGGKCIGTRKYFFGEKISAMIRHLFQSCGTYFHVRRRTSSVPPKDTILHYFTLSYTILHYLTLSYTTI